MLFQPFSAFYWLYLFLINFNCRKLFACFAMRLLISGNNTQYIQLSIDITDKVYTHKGVDELLKAIDLI